MTAGPGGLPLSSPSLRSPFSSMPRSSLASRALRGPPGCPQIRPGRAAPGPDCSKTATPVLCSRFGNSRQATPTPAPPAPARPLRGRGAADWAAGADAAAAQPPVDPASRAQQQFRLRRPKETARAERGAGQRRRALGEGRGEARGDEHVRSFQRARPAKGALIGHLWARLLARTDAGRGREGVVCDAGNVVTPPCGFAGWCVSSDWSDDSQ